MTEQITSPESVERNIDNNMYYIRIKIVYIHYLYKCI